MASILLVEDDAALGEQVATYLREQDLEVIWWTRGHSIEPSMPPLVDLVILDLMLPGRTGFEVLEDLRRCSDVPVLVLSARDDTESKVQALRLGADDFVTKPFWPEELVERVKARLRRPVLQRQDRVQLGGLEIDYEQREVWVEGKSVHLSPAEYGVLEALTRRPGAAVTRRWLVVNVLDPDREGNERTLDVHVSRLRRKIGKERVETVWGIGYRIPAEAAE